MFVYYRSNSDKIWQFNEFVIDLLLKSTRSMPEFLSKTRTEKNSTRYIRFLLEIIDFSVKASWNCCTERLKIVQNRQSLLLIGYFITSLWITRWILVHFWKVSWVHLFLRSSFLGITHEIRQNECIKFALDVRRAVSQNNYIKLFKLFEVCL